MDSSQTTPLDIKSSFGGYQVLFLESLERCLSQAKIPGAFFFVDERVYQLYRKDFDKLKIKPLLWTASEEKKTYGALEAAFDLLISAGFKKASRLVVVGGGILQDAGGFVASTLFRGVAWDLIPTTLLAQADSCIGAKTSVNVAAGKNLIGTFSAPKTVFLTSDVLKTLTPSDVRSGLCEAMKLAMVDGPETVAWMSERIASAFELKGLDGFLHRALSIKKRYIEEDEFDRGVRNILNYGHTFGHAFESLTKYAIPHGVAVGIGIEAAAFFSWQLGMVTESHFRDVQTTLKPLISTERQLLKSLRPQDLVKIMKTDKKNITSDITFILSQGYGKLVKQALPVEKAEKLLTDYLGEIET